MFCWMRRKHFWLHCRKFSLNSENFSFKFLKIWKIKYIIQFFSGRVLLRTPTMQFPQSCRKFVAKSLQMIHPKTEKLYNFKICTNFFCWQIVPLDTYYAATLHKSFCSDSIKLSLKVGENLRLFRVFYRCWCGDVVFNFGKTAENFLLKLQKLFSQCPTESALSFIFSEIFLKTRRNELENTNFCLILCLLD